jgi:hypothetical protein
MIRKQVGAGGHLGSSSCWDGLSAVPELRP